MMCGKEQASHASHGCPCCGMLFTSWQSRRHVLLYFSFSRTPLRCTMNFSTRSAFSVNHVEGGCCASIYPDLILMSLGFESTVGIYVQPISEARPRQVSTGILKKYRVPELACAVLGSDPYHSPPALGGWSVNTACRLPWKCLELVRG